MECNLKNMHRCFAFFMLRIKKIWTLTVSQINFFFFIEVALECQEKKKKIEKNLNHIIPLCYLELQ